MGLFSKEKDNKKEKKKDFKCYSCGKTFNKYEVTEWKGLGNHPVCPRCGSENVDIQR